MKPDPFDAAEWNLLQVIGWVYTRDSQLVRECSDDNDADQPANILTVMARGAELEDAGLSMPFPSFKAAESNLLAKCFNAAIKPTARQHGDGERKYIPSNQLSGAAILYDPNGIGPKDDLPRHAKWQHVLFPRDVV